MPSMQEDNVYKRQTTVQHTPPEQEDEEQKLSVEVMNEFPLIKEAIDMLKEDEAFFLSYNSIPDSVTLDHVEFMHTVNGNKKAVASIKAAITHLEDLVQDYAKKR